MKKHTKYLIAHGIVILYDIVIMPFRVIRLCLNWWNENVGYALVAFLADWANKQNTH